MYFGSLNSYATVTFTHPVSPIPCPPDSCENGHWSWDWERILNTAVEARYTLDRACCVGAVSFVTDEPIASLCVEVFLDGKRVAVYRTPNKEALEERTVIPVGAEGKELVLRLSSELETLALTEPEILGCFEDGKPFLWPTVANASYGEDCVAIRELICDSDDADAVFAKSFLSETLDERFDGWMQTDGVPLRLVIRPDDTEERYTVEVTEEAITLSATCRRGLLYAVGTLVELCRDGRFPLGVIDDQPAFPMRGVHVGLPARDSLDFFKRLCRYVFLPLRYNQIIVEFAGGMRFDRHPEISEKWLEADERHRAGLQPKMPHSTMVSGGRLLEKDEVRDIVDYAKSLGFEVIPEVQSFGHVQYITYAHPEIAEVAEEENVLDARNEDVTPNSFYAQCYCPSNPKSYEIIYDIIDEIVEVVRPERYVHMGHDEIRIIGQCPRCRDKDHADLYVKHVTAMHDYLAKRGLGMMIWSDMLHFTEIKKYKTHPAIEKIPRDIVLLDFIWYFHFDLDIEDHLLPYGYRVMMGNLYSSHYPRYETRAKKPGMIGGQLSFWVPTCEERLADNGKMWELLYVAEMLWNNDYRGDARRVYTHLLTKLVQPRMRDALHGVRPVADRKRVALPLPNGEQNAIPAELLAHVPQAILADGAQVEVNARFDRLVFEHATAFPMPRPAWAGLPEIGKYLITYADGTTEEMPVCYAGGAMQWNTRYAEPATHKYYRHLGYFGTWLADPMLEAKTGDGEDVMTLGLVWENPHPEKTIASVTYHRNENEYCTLILAGVHGVEF